MFLTDESKVFMRSSLSSSTSSSKPSSKESKRDILKEQQRIWLNGMHQEKLTTAKSFPAPLNAPAPVTAPATENADVIFNNWNSVLSIKSSNQRAPSRTSDNGNACICRICYETMQLPMLVVPCGHSFCQKVFIAFF